MTVFPDRALPYLLAVKGLAEEHLQVALVFAMVSSA